MLTVAQIEEITAQETHALIGFVLLLLLALYFPGNLFYLADVYLALFAIEVLKEFSWDMNHEKGATYLGGAVDFAFYYVGAVIAAILLWATHKPF